MIAGHSNQQNKNYYMFEEKKKLAKQKVNTIN